MNVGSFFKPDRINGRYKCTVPSCLYLTDTLEKYHLHINKPHQLFQVVCDNSCDDKRGISLENTWVRIDKHYNAAVCHTSQVLLSKDEIVEHCTICPYCNLTSYPALNKFMSNNNITIRDDIEQLIDEIKNGSTSANNKPIYGLQVEKDNTGEGDYIMVIKRHGDSLTDKLEHILLSFPSETSPFIPLHEPLTINWLENSVKTQLLPYAHFFKLYVLGGPQQNVDPLARYFFQWMYNGLMDFPQQVRICGVGIIGPFRAKSSMNECKQEFVRLIACLERLTLV